MSKLTCAEFEDTLPALALGVLDDADRLSAIAHIDGCPECKAQYRQYMSVALGLLEAVPQRIPPASLKGALMKAIVPQQRARFTKLREWLQYLQPLPRWGWGSLLAASILILSLVGVRFTILTNQQQELTRQLAEQQLTVAVLARNNNESVAMIGTANAKDASATLLFDAQATSGVLLVRNLPALPAEKTYQLWLVDSTGQRDSGAVFTVPPDANGPITYVVYAPRSLKSYVRCGVSIEPRGGSPKPTGPAALTGSYT